MAEAPRQRVPLVLDKYSIDELYGAVIIQPLCGLDECLLERH